MSSLLVFLSIYYDLLDSILNKHLSWPFWIWFWTNQNSSTESSVVDPIRIRIRIQCGTWIRIDPDPGGQKWLTTEKVNKFHFIRIYLKCWIRIRIQWIHRIRIRIYNNDWKFVMWRTVYGMLHLIEKVGRPHQPVRLSCRVCQPKHTAGNAFLSNPTLHSTYSTVSYVNHR